MLHVYVFTYFYKIHLMRKSTAGFVSVMLNYIRDMDTVCRIKWQGVIKVDFI